MANFYTNALRLMQRGKIDMLMGNGQTALKYALFQQTYTINRDLDVAYSLQGSDGNALASPSVAPGLTANTTGGTIPASSLVYVAVTYSNINRSQETVLSALANATVSAGSTNSITVAQPSPYCASAPFWNVYAYSPTNTTLYLANSSPLPISQTSYTLAQIPANTGTAQPSTGTLALSRFEIAAGSGYSTGGNSITSPTLSFVAASSSWPAPWTANTPYNVGQIVVPQSGYGGTYYFFLCIGAGTSATSGTPSWVAPTANPPTLGDGTVTWLSYGQYIETFTFAQSSLQWPTASFSNVYRGALYDSYTGALIASDDFGGPFGGSGGTFTVQLDPSGIYHALSNA